MELQMEWRMQSLNWELHRQYLIMGTPYCHSFWFQFLCKSWGSVEFVDRCLTVLGCEREYLLSAKSGLVRENQNKPNTTTLHLLQGLRSFVNSYYWKGDDLRSILYSLYACAFMQCTRPIRPMHRCSSPNSKSTAIYPPSSVDVHALAEVTCMWDTKNT